MALVVLVPGSAFAATCESLTALTLPHTKVDSAQSVPAGQFAPPGRGGRGGADVFKSLPAFCRVALTLTPTSDSDIKVEVWLPASGWNGKYLAVGNGGWAGSISYPALAASLARGYATSSTDTGHSTPGGAFVVGHPEKFVDFAWRSVHEMAVASMRIAGEAHWDDLVPPWARGRRAEILARIVEEFGARTRFVDTEARVR